jgi:hypothetical protein
LLISLSLLEVGTFGYAMMQQLLLRRPWGDRPMSNEGLMVLGPIMMLMGVATLYLFHKMALVVEVREDGLHCSFVPFMRRTIAFGNIKRCEVRSYNPLKEYGGWGVRFGRSGKAYNVSGNRGVQLELSSGERLLLGSQRPEELAAAMEARIQQ